MQGQHTPILSSVNVFDYRNFPEITKEEVEELWSEYHHVDGSNNLFKEVVEYREFIRDYVLQLHTKNITMYSHVALPDKGAELSEVQ